MRQFVYSSSELMEYYKSRGITYDNVDSKIKLLLHPYAKEKTIFFPYIGEFGSGVIKYLVRFHYMNAKHKVACIPRGYECFFPDAKEFIYDYPGPKWDEYKGNIWIFSKDMRSVRAIDHIDETIDNPKKELGRFFKYFVWEAKPHIKQRSQFMNFIKSVCKENYDVVGMPMRTILDPFTNKSVHLFAKIPFKNPNKYGIKVDVVFSNRNRGRDLRSFQKWDKIIEHLQKKGLVVGGIGKPSDAFIGTGVINNFEYDNPNEAMMEMLHSAKYYIGTDTGPTHIAMNFTHLRSLLFRMNDYSPNWISDYESENTRIIHEMCKDINTFNDESILIRHIDEFIT